MYKDTKHAIRLSENIIRRVRTLKEFCKSHNDKLFLRCIVPCIFYFQVPVVGSARFELTNAGVKVPCLTTWRRPNINIPIAFYLSVCKRYPLFRYPLVFAVSKFLCTYTRSAKWSCDRLVRALIETSITYCYEAVWWLRPVLIA